MSDGDVLHDDDGTRLLLMSDIGELTGWKIETIKQYSTAGNRARLEGTAGPKDMPAAVRKVKRTMTKADGKPLAVWSPLWREDQIRNWLRARGVETP